VRAKTIKQEDWMKMLRWVTFLPLALAGGLAANLLISIIGASVPFVAEHRVINRFALGISGVAFSGVLFAIGFRVVPTVNRRSKWLLGGTALLVGIIGIGVAGMSQDPEAVATSVGVIGSALLVLASSLGQLGKWFRAQSSPLTF
jgi:hypothetical protein